MIGTIGPLVKGVRNQWWQSMALHLMGGAVGGGLFFGALGLIGQALLKDLQPSVRWALAGLIALVFGFSGFGLMRIPLPRTYRAVPRTWWWDFGPNQAAFAYGLVLGVGVTTIIPFGTFYVVAVWAVLAADAGYGVALGVSYGLARAVPVLVASLAMAAQRDMEKAIAVGIEVADRAGGKTIVAVNGIANGTFAIAAFVAVVLTLW